MTTEYLKLAIIALIVTILVLTVKKHNEAIATVLVLTSCCICAIFICNFVEPVFDFIHMTAQTAGIDKQLQAPLFKILGVGLLTQFSADICADAGQTALAKVVQTGGTILCICLSLPLLDAVLSLAQTLSGG